MCNPVFIKIAGDIFNVSKIQSVQYQNEKNRLGNDSGIYTLSIYMEGGIGSLRKVYSSKKERDDDFMEASSQLSKYSIAKAIRTLERVKRCEKAIGDQKAEINEKNYDDEIKDIKRSKKHIDDFHS